MDFEKNNKIFCHTDFVYKFGFDEIIVFKQNTWYKMCDYIVGTLFMDWEHGMFLFHTLDINKKSKMYYNNFFCGIKGARKYKLDLIDEL